MISKAKSDYIYIMKAIAVMSIVAAHCKLSNCENAGIAISIMLYITTYFGEVGVPIFFALSGYLFNTSYSFLEFIRKKAINIVVPWIFCSFLVWIYMTIQGDCYSIISWILGLNNVYWYMPVLIAYFLIFYILRNKHIRLAFFILTIIYHILVYDFEFFNELRQIIILGKVLQFMPYFLVGTIVRDYSLERRIKKLISSKMAIALSVIGLAGLTAYSFINWGGINYRSPLFLTYSLFATIIFCSIGYRIMVINSVNCKRLFTDIGKDSFTIYLVHLPLAGIASNVFSRTRITSFFIILYPLIIICAIKLVLLFLRKINSRYNVRWLFRLIGAK